ncbi:MAG TPA: chromate transporter [Dehalococcoidia bacterium]|nr:chromate transporter [Dehalococcoidia bacterium]
MPSDRSAPDRPPLPAVQSSRPAAVGLWLLFRAFGTIGLISMGGGRFAYYFHELVTRRRWFSEQEMLERLAISQLLPGPNVSNLAVLLGQRLRGFRGAALALIATLGPGALLMLGLSAFYFARGQVPGAGPAFRGIAAAAAGLALGTTVQIGWKSARGLRAALLGLLTLVAVLVLHLPTLLAILLLGALGVLLFRAPLPKRPALLARSAKAAASKGETDGGA